MTMVYHLYVVYVDDGQLIMLVLSVLFVRHHYDSLPYHIAYVRYCINTNLLLPQHHIIRHYSDPIHIHQLIVVYPIDLNVFTIVP